MRIWRCRTCQVDGIHGFSPEQYPELNFVEPWKFGKLYQCSKCRCNWFSSEAGPHLTRLRDELFSQAEHWNRTPLQVDDAVLKTLASIGGTAYHGHGIAFPCAVATARGEVDSKALILVTRTVPHNKWSPAVIRWANEIASVKPSPYALPFNVRKALAEAKEISMGYAPLAVLDKQRERYILSGISLFFETNGVKGDEVTLADDQSNLREKFVWSVEYGCLIWLILELIKAIIKIIIRPKKPFWEQRIVPPVRPNGIYIVDWFEGCEELLTKPEKESDATLADP